MRDCTCDRPECYLCQLYHKDPAYKAYWDGEPAETGGVVQFAQAIMVELAWRSSGGRGPSPEEKLQRRTTCDRCHERTQDDRCRPCTCYLEARLIPPIPFGKLDCATQKCPRDFWGYAGGYTGPKCGGCGSPS